MKTLTHLFSICICVLIRFYAIAQTDSHTNPLFKNLDSISNHLLIHELSLMNFPLNDPCGRTGIPPVCITLPDTGRTLPFEPPVDYNPRPDSSYNKAPGDVNIYWIHGLNGTVKSLRIAAVATEYGYPGIFDARKAHSIVPLFANDQSYSEEGGIRDAAIDLNNSVLQRNDIVQTEYDFIIAHSQGGIVAREWLRNMEENPSLFANYAHGLVTMGTPHSGAIILNKTRPDLENTAPAFFNEACRSLGGAVLQDRIKSRFFTNLIISQHMREKILTASCDFFSSTVIPFALDNYHKSTTNDYYVGAKFLTQANRDGHPTSLSDYALKVPVVQFYGEEQQPIMWRFFSSTMKLGVDQLSQNGSADDKFAYEQDDQLQITADELSTEFHAKYLIEQKNLKVTKARLKCAFVFARMGPNQMGVITYTACKLTKKRVIANIQKRIDAYDNAVHWLSNANDYYLTDIVGAKSVITQAFCVSYRQALCRDPKINPLGSGVPAHSSSSNKEVIATSGGCNNGTRNVSYSSYPYCCCEGVETTRTVYKTISSYKPNDGVVLAESAAYHFKVAAGQSHTYRVMPNTNHDQMKNSNATKEALVELYKGNLGERFKVELR